MEDDDLAVGVAKTAGAILLAVRAAGLLEGKAAGSAGDAIAHVWIERALREARPDDGFLSEEGADDHARLQHRRVWVVDPLDGTREFSEGRHDWAVHVALVIDGVPSAAAVALPALDVVLSTASPLKLASPPDGPLRIVVSRTRAPELAELVAQRLGAELVPQGSAGFKTMAVVRGEAHAYVHAGGQYEWDSAAPVGVAASAGAHVSRLDGSELRYNQADPLLPDLVVCRPEIASELLAAIADVSG